MPVLTNTKHEAFAHPVAKGLPQHEAYKAAGHGQGQAPNAGPEATCWNVPGAGMRICVGPNRPSVPGGSEPQHADIAHLSTAKKQNKKQKLAARQQKSLIQPPGNPTNGGRLSILGRNTLVQ